MIKFYEKDSFVDKVLNQNLDLVNEMNKIEDSIDNESKENIKKVNEYTGTHYVKVIFKDHVNGKVLSIKGWLVNPYPSNLAVVTKEGCLNKFMFKDVLQMYKVLQPSDVEYMDTQKRENSRRMKL